MVKIKNIKIIILSMFLLITLSFNVNAFGVSSPYWDDNPLYMHPGETKDVVMVLQNMVGGENIKMTAELNSGKEIAMLTDQSTTYNVPLGSNNVPVHLKITVPSNAKPKQEWQVGVSFKTIAENTGGVSIGGAVDKGFKVIIAQPKISTQAPKETKITQNSFGFIILVVILVTLILTLKHFNKKKEESK